MCGRVYNIYSAFTMFVPTLKKIYLEHKGHVFQEKWVTYCFSVVSDKIVCLLVVGWCHLQMTMICGTIKKLYIKINLVFSKGN